MSELLPQPEPGPEAAAEFVARHLDGLYRADGSVSPIRGGQSWADRALAALDLTDYSRTRNNVYPLPERGVSGLSPYIRHGLLDLPTVWHHAADAGPEADVHRFRLELLWQEYARHRYARVGRLPPRADGSDRRPGWDTSMGCIEATTDELEDDGQLPGQARLWLAAHWTTRLGRDWREGEDYFFTHLLDGSRAANRLGWQLASGVDALRPYQFTRWQVERRAPGLCASCDHVADCPIDQPAPVPPHEPIDADPRLSQDSDLHATAGPDRPMPWAGHEPPEVVWVTAESLGDRDPALAAHPDLPAAFVFDRALLARLQLSAKRLVFLVETLAELAGRRPLELWLGSPSAALNRRSVAATFAPVPGWRQHAGRINPGLVHPWPWLRRPSAGNIARFSIWFEYHVGVRLDEQPLDALIPVMPVAEKVS